MSFFSQIVSFVQERLGPSLGQGTVSEPGRFSAPSLLKEFHGKRLDPQIYDNALRILNLSDDLSVVKIEEQLQYISTSLKKKRISVSAPLALIFDEMIRDVEMAYKTVMAGPPSRSAECTSLILYGPTARKPVGLLKAISEKPSYNLLRTPEEISSVVKTYFPNA